MIIVPLILLLVWITLVLHPTAKTLGHPGLFSKYFDAFAPFRSLRGFWFTMVLCLSISRFS